MNGVDRTDRTDGERSRRRWAGQDDPQREAYRRWQRHAGPAAAFVLPTPFLGPVPMPRVARHPYAARLAAGLTRRAAGAGRTVVLLDVPPRLGIATGFRLVTQGWWVAPLFGRWPVSGAVLETDAVAAWLAAATAPGPTAHAGRAGGGEDGARSGHVCLVLDGDRARRVSPAVLRRRFDNRFEYGAHMLPPPARLRRWSVARVVFAARAATVPADLEEYAEGLATAGLPVDLTSLVALGLSRSA